MKNRVHFRSLRLFVNAGMCFPLCQENVSPMDTDKSRWETTGDPTKVTCVRCRNRVIMAAEHVAKETAPVTKSETTEDKIKKMFHAYVEHHLESFTNCTKFDSRNPSNMNDVELSAVEYADQFRGWLQGANRQATKDIFHGRDIFGQLR